MKKWITQVLEEDQLTSQHYNWQSNYGIEELHVCGDLYEKDALAIRVAEVLHHNKIKFKLHTGHCFRFHTYP